MYVSHRENYDLKEKKNWHLKSLRVHFYGITRSLKPLWMRRNLVCVYRETRPFMSVWNVVREKRVMHTTTWGVASEAESFKPCTQELQKFIWDDALWHLFEVSPKHIDMNFSKQIQTCVMLVNKKKKKSFYSENENTVEGQIVFESCNINEPNVRVMETEVNILRAKIHARTLIFVLWYSLSCLTGGPYNLLGIISLKSSSLFICKETSWYFGF